MRSNQIHMKYGNLSKFNSHIPFLVWETCTFFCYEIVLIIYLPTFCESNAWDFYLVMSKISGSVQATSEDFQWISEDFWTLPEIECSQMLQRCLSTSKATKKMTLSLAYFDFVRTQKRTQSHHVVKNNLSGFVGQTNCPWCIRSMYLVHRCETHA